MEHEGHIVTTELPLDLILSLFSAACLLAVYFPEMCVELQHLKEGRRKEGKKERKKGRKKEGKI